MRDNSLIRGLVTMVPSKGEESKSKSTCRGEGQQAEGR